MSQSHQSVTDRSDADRSPIPGATAALIRAVPEAGGPRLVVLGGGGSLLNEDGVRFIDAPGIPEQYRTEALRLLREEAPEELDWTYLSPPPARPHPRRPTRRLRDPR